MLDTGVYRWYNKGVIKREGVLDMKYEVVVGGTVVGRYGTKAEAEQRLYEVRHSYLAMVHPQDCMFIREREVR